MVLNNRIIIMLTTLLLFIPQERCLILEGASLTINTVQAFIKLWDFVNQTFDINDKNLPKETVRVILSKVMEMSDVFDTLENQLYFNEPFLSKIVVSQLYKIEHKDNVFKLFEDIDYFNRMDDVMKRYVNNGLLFLIDNIDVGDPILEKTTIEGFANSIVMNSTKSVLLRNERMCDQVLGTKPAFQIELVKGGLYRQLLYYYKEGYLASTQSPYDLLITVYSLIENAQLKAYRLIQFAFLILQVYNLGEFSQRSKQLTEQYLKYVKKHAEEIRVVTKTANRRFLKPDPPVYLKSNYEEVTKLKTAIILNEADISEGDTCVQDCSTYKNTKQYRCSQKNKDQCRQQRRCSGPVTDCKLGGGSSMSICAPFDLSSRRRYYKINYDAGTIYGNERRCDVSRRVDSWIRFFVKCHYCMCWCDESNDADSYRHFNKRPVVSDIQNNKIITGIRLQRVNNVFHIQIQEGKYDNSRVSYSTVAWQEYKPYNISSAVSGKDYHSVTADHSTVHLDNVKLPKGYLLTGIRFVTVQGNLQLAIRGTKYLGNKLRNESAWFNDKPAGRRKQIELGYDIPINFRGHEEISPTLSKLRFKTTSLEEDVGQSIVPFLDTRDVAVVPPSPLVGAGIYHRGRRGSGGFIALSVTTYSDLFENDRIVKKIKNTVNNMIDCLKKVCDKNYLYQTKFSSRFTLDL